jgi:hypothetical protein
VPGDLVWQAALQRRLLQGDGIFRYPFAPAGVNAAAGKTKPACADSPGRGGGLCAHSRTQPSV